jgi:hypothetical protein
MDNIGDVAWDTSPPLVHTKPVHAHKTKHAQTQCLNCETPLTGDFCHNCGQTAHIHRSMGHVLEEVVHGITHLDSRTWRSLPMLLWRPGTLTRNYVMGKRARYVPPFGMFLASVFAMFLAFAFSGGPKIIQTNIQTPQQAVASAQEQVRDAQNELDAAKTQLDEAKAEHARIQADPNAAPGALGQAWGEMGGAEGELRAAEAQMQIAQSSLARARAGAVSAPANQTFATQREKDLAIAELQTDIESAKKENNALEVSALSLTKSAIEKAPVTQSQAPNGPQSTTTKIEIDSSDGENVMEMLKDSMRRGDFITTPWPEINDKIRAKIQNPDLFLYKLQNTVYKFSFLLVPLSLPFIWLMFFWKRGVTMFDHAVFALYSLSFVSFLFLTVSVLGHWLPVGQVSGYAFLILPIHLFFQFKGAYSLGWFSALWRTLVFCSVFSWTILSFFVVAIIALGVTG